VLITHNFPLSPYPDAAPVGPITEDAVPASSTSPDPPSERERLLALNASLVCPTSGEFAACLSVVLFLLFPSGMLFVRCVVFRFGCGREASNRFQSGGFE